MNERPLPKSLQDLFAKHPDKFAEGWMEKDYSEGESRPWSHWVYLKPGWANLAVDPMGGLHIIHESTIGEVKSQFRRVGKCNCEDCRRELAKK